MREEIKRWKLMFGFALHSKEDVYQFVLPTVQNLISLLTGFYFKKHVIEKIFVLK